MDTVKNVKETIASIFGDTSCFSIANDISDIMKKYKVGSKTAVCYYLYTDKGRDNIKKYGLLFIKNCARFIGK